MIEISKSEEYALSLYTLGDIGELQVGAHTGYRCSFQVRLSKIETALHNSITIELIT